VNHTRRAEARRGLPKACWGWRLPCRSCHPMSPSSDKSCFTIGALSAQKRGPTSNIQVRTCNLQPSTSMDHGAFPDLALSCPGLARSFPQQWAVGGYRHDRGPTSAHPDRGFVGTGHATAVASSPKQKSACRSNGTSLDLERVKIQDSRFKIQDSRLKTQDSRLKTQDSRLKTQDSSEPSPRFPESGFWKPKG